MERHPMEPAAPSGIVHDQHYHQHATSWLPLESFDLKAFSSFRKELARREGGASQKVTAACLNCHNCHLACDLARPCRKCVRLGIRCVERTMAKKRGRKPKLRTPAQVVGLPVNKHSLDCLLNASPETETQQAESIEIESYGSDSLSAASTIPSSVPTASNVRDPPRNSWIDSKPLASPRHSPLSDRLSELSSASSASTHWPGSADMLRGDTSGDCKEGTATTMQDDERLVRIMMRWNQDVGRPQVPRKGPASS